MPTNIQTISNRGQITMTNQPENRKKPLLSRRLAPGVMAVLAIVALARILPAASPDYCSVGGNLSAAKDAVRGAQSNLDKQPARPISLGDLNVAKAMLKAKLAQRKIADVERNAADSKLATHRFNSAAKLKQIARELAALPPTVTLEAAIKSAEFRLRNQTSAQKQARVRLVVAKSDLQRTRDKLDRLETERTTLKQSLSSGRVTTRRAVADVEAKIKVLDERISKGTGIASKQEAAVKKLEGEVFPDADERREIEELPQNRRQLLRRTQLEAEKAKLQATDALLKANLDAAEARLKTAREDVSKTGSRITAIVKRNREIATWETVNRRLKTELATANAELNRRQAEYNSAVLAKNASLAKVKGSAALATLNARNLAFQKEKKVKAKAIAAQKERTWRKRVFARKYDAKTQKYLLDKLSIYYRHVYIRELHRRIITEYKQRITSLERDLKQLQPFDCDTFTDAQAYAKGLRRWIANFKKWIGERTTKYNTANRKAGQLAAEFNKVWKRPRHGLTDVSVMQGRVTITLWDHGMEDGDIVDLYLNGKPYRRVHLKKKKTQLAINFGPGTHQLTIVAVNEGRFVTNTASMVISHVNRGKQVQTWTLKTNQKASMKIHVPGS